MTPSGVFRIVCVDSDDVDEDELLMYTPQCLVLILIARAESRTMSLKTTSLQSAHTETLAQMFGDDERHHCLRSESHVIRAEAPK